MSLAADFWRSFSNDTYLGVTAHWIDNDWILCSVALQVRHVSKCHTAEQCSKEFAKVSKQCKLDGKVAVICTDSARTICVGMEYVNFPSPRCAALTL